MAGNNQVGSTVGGITGGLAGGALLGMLDGPLPILDTVGGIDRRKDRRNYWILYA